MIVIRNRNACPKEDPVSQPPVALVTGAAGGVGRALIDRFRADGWAVVAEDLAETVTELAADDVAVVVGDASLTETAERAVATALDRFGRLDAVVNNAARFLRAPLTETTDEDWDALVAVNLRSVFVHCRAAVPALAESKGSIVNVASISGMVGLADQVAYSSTKGAVVQLTRQLAVECGPAGVRVNAIAAGAIDTDFTAGFKRTDAGPMAAAESLSARYPLGRISSPAEVADTIAFLAGASAVTGAILPVDGGYTAR
jgi:NAD(P)-dependent dehydrogenase (short-subunit alcohol dehydrogenase family)